MMKNKKTLIKVICIIFIIVVSIHLLRFTSLEKMREFVSSFGNKAPIIYILMYSILPIFFFPVPVFVLVSGVVFGIKDGFLYTMIGCFINSTIMYYIAKFLGKDFFEKIIDKKLSYDLKIKLLTDNQKSLTSLFLVLRLIPLVSYNLINYMAGLTKINYINYIVVTMLGIVPGMLVFLNTGDKSLDIRSKDFIISLILLLLLIVISSIFTKIYLSRGKNGNDNSTNIQ